jgi:hypothetical protein
MKHFMFFAITIVFVNKALSQLSFGFNYILARDAVIVKHVFKNSPAEKAGVKPEDWIISINGIRMDTVNDTKKTAILLNAPVKTVFILGELDDEGELWAGRTVSITREDKSLFLKKCHEGNCLNGTGRYLDAEGAEYTGSFKDGKKEGKGKSVTWDGFTYDGDWKNNKKEGRGIYIYQPGSDVFLYHYWRYEGDWKNDMMNGKGKYVFHDSSHYSGDVKDNMRSGQGRLVLKDGTAYEGEWKSDKLNGKATVSFPNGDKRTGNFVDGLLEGEVTVYTKASGTTTTVTYKKGVTQ